jgi:GAF domain-containing protein
MHDGAPDPQRVARLTDAVVHAGRDHGSLCAASAGVAQVDGAGVILIMRGRVLGVVCCSDVITEAVEEVQYTLGEGPCIDAFTTKQPVLVPDLGDATGSRWPGFRDGALAAGVRSAFGFPLLVGSVCIGALNLYQRHPGMLSDEQLADAVVLAHIAGQTVLAWQSVAGAGSLARELEHLSANRAIVHQATGMISVQASTSVGDASALLRAYAFSTDQPITGVASDVVRGALRFD